MNNKTNPTCTCRCKEHGTDEESQLREFFGNTSLHGVRYFTERSVLRRLIWFVALGAAIGICSKQVSDTLRAFYGRPFSSTLTRHRDSAIDFPAVTLCNMNTMSKKQYAITAKKWGISRQNQSDSELREEIQAFMSIFSYNEYKDVNMEKTMQRLGSLPFFSERGPFWKECLAGFSHSINGMLSLDMLGPCTWRGKPCTSLNFTSFVNLQMGQCFTFNSGQQGHQRLRSIVAGPSNGLSLKLNLEEADHVSNAYGLEAGFKVLLHDQNEYPLIEEFGFALQPGTHTFAAVREQRYKNLKKPFKTMCDSPEKPFSKFFNYSYSLHACVKQCMHEYVIDKCHCQALFNITPGVELCSLKDAFECVYPTIFGDMPDKIAKCSNLCPEPCEYKKYDTRLSYASAVGNSFSRAIPSQLQGIESSEYLKDFLNKTEKERQAFIRNNVVSLDVYYEELGYDFIEQKPVFDSWALLGAVGGTLGLFLGTSILTVLEFIDFFVVWLMRRLRRDRSRKPSIDKASTSTLKKEDLGEYNHSMALDTRIIGVV